MVHILILQTEKKKKKATINPKYKDDNLFNMQQQLHSIVEELSGTHKDFEILNHIHIII